MAKSGIYTPRDDEAQADKESDRSNLTGRSPRAILKQQASGQRRIAENEKWLIARKTNPSRPGGSRLALEKLGFKVNAEFDELFYEVEPPKGWTKSTDGYWTTVKDETGAERLSQFFKAAFYDQDAFVNFK